MSTKPRGPSYPRYGGCHRATPAGCRRARTPAHWRPARRSRASMDDAVLVDDDSGNTFGCVRLLLTELAAALHVQPGWQEQQ
eukprot:5186809-Prymnesium_polylepis.1